MSQFACFYRIAHVIKRFLQTSSKLMLETYIAFSKRIRKIDSQQNLRSREPKRRMFLDE